MTRLRGLLRDAWTIARPYWWSEDRGAASRLLLVVVVLNLGIVYINVLLNLEAHASSGPSRPLIPLRSR